jgi:essential nuclear protein 1
MGKAKKIKVSKREAVGPLGEQILKGEVVEPTGRQKERQRMDEDDEYVESRLSKNIITQARLQAAEIESELGLEGNVVKTAAPITLGNAEESDKEDSDDDLDSAKYDDGEINVNEDDDLAIKMFMRPSGQRTRTLADIINEKITEKKTEIDTQFSDATDVAKDINPAVADMYVEVGKLLTRYRAGKIPKAFKMIPQFRNWEQLLLLTEPDQWSAAATYEATRIFTSNLKEKMAQRYFNLLLLPRIRDDIDTYHRLNFHLYQALRKALFKPGAFFKGFLLPLCESGTCTLREAVIVGSVLAKNTIPVLHSCAAMLKIAEMEYSGANSIFLRILLDKKYALPYRVVDSVVFHFLNFRSDKREMPVLWHQALLTFAQRYKQDVSSEQKQALLELLKIHYHPKLTEEVRRELQNSRCRDEETAEPPPGFMDTN